MDPMMVAVANQVPGEGLALLPKAAIFGSVIEKVHLAAVSMYRMLVFVQPSQRQR